MCIILEQSTKNLLIHSISINEPSSPPHSWSNGTKTRLIHVTLTNVFFLISQKWGEVHSSTMVHSSELHGPEDLKSLSITPPFYFPNTIWENGSFKLLILAVTYNKIKYLTKNIIQSVNKEKNIKIYASMAMHIFALQYHDCSKIISL